MSLPEGFAFSQSSLQDFVDCPRRFELRYLLHLSWPAIQSEPANENERAMQHGARFHHMAHQLLLGLPSEQLANQVNDPDLQLWWSNFTELVGDMSVFPPESIAYPEIGLSAAMGDVRLVAKCDLILVTPDGHLTIFDWKTAQKQPRRDWLQRRLQTRLYPVLLVRAGAHLVGGQAISPSQVDMVYWYAGEPDQPVRFVYSEQQYQEDSSYLSGLLDRVKQLNPGQFQLTPVDKHCRYCVYRSLCDRGVSAGEVEELDLALSPDDVNELDFDFESLSEIEF
jgi:hypothetical protein